MKIRDLLEREANANREFRSARDWDQEWHQRKMQRFFQPIREAAKQLKNELTRRGIGTVIISNDCVQIALNDSRELNISLSLYFDRKDHLNQKFQIVDREIRRIPDYEEIDSIHVFPTAEEAVHYVVRICAGYLDR